MRYPRVLRLAAVALLAVAAVAYAQTTVVPLPDNAPVAATSLDVTAVSELAKTHWGDPAKGATLAGTCAACHGLDGNATADPSIYPRLAGQSENYIAHQLALFKSGERNTGMAAIMMPFASMLSAQDMRDVGAHYAQQKGGSGIADDTIIATGPNAGKKFYEVGEKLFHSGDAARGIPACMACHGPAGAGNPGPAYPRLAGQQAWYISRRLTEYRAGTTTERDPHQFNIMAMIAKPLTDEEISSLGSYMQGLHKRDVKAMLASAGSRKAAPAEAPGGAGTTPVPAAAAAPAGAAPAATSPAGAAPAAAPAALPAAPPTTPVSDPAGIVPAPTPTTPKPAT